MDTREKFNIKQMVDCEKQEPFYPATHALAIKVIDEGLVKNLQDILSVLLDFVRTYGNIDLSNLLELGHEYGTAFPGDEGYALLQDILDILPISDIVELDDNHPVSGDAVYNYIQSLIGIVEDNSSKLVTGDAVYEYVSTLEPNGDIRSGETRPVTGGKIYDALQELLGSLLWETDDNVENSIKQKSNTLQVTNPNEVAIGLYNESTGLSTVFSVGIGDENLRVNSLEVTKDVNNSVKVPFDGNYVSIQKHMRNGQENIKHLNLTQLDKLDILISERWKASWTFSGNTIGGSYYDNNGGINLSWSIKDSNGSTNNVLILNMTRITLKLGNNYVNIVNSISNSSGNYSITNFDNNSSLLFTFNPNGNNSFIFRMYTLTNEITPIQYKDSTINLYAPIYAFYSDNASLTSIPNNATVIHSNSLNSFEASVNIPSGINQYIYLAFPNYINMPTPTMDELPLQVKGSFEFNLAIAAPLGEENLEPYYGKLDTSKEFNINNLSGVSTNYNIVRSLQRLNPGLWEIVKKK